MERVHDLFDGGGVVPPVHVKKVNIRRAQLFERGFHGDVKGLGAIPRIVHHVGDIPLFPALVVGRVLGCDDELVADATLLSPLADEGLGSLVLTVFKVNEITYPSAQGGESSLIVCRINEVALEGWVRTAYTEKARSGWTTYTCVKVCIEKLEGRRLIHRAHSEFLPLVADAHSTELQGRHAHACEGRECAITSELGRRERRG